MLAKLLLFMAPLLVPAFLSLAFIAPDAGVLSARSAVQPSVGAVRPAVVGASAGSLAKTRNLHATPEATHGKAHGSCPGRKASEAAARQAV
jgi:hypothetical protein